MPYFPSGVFDPTHHAYQRARALLSDHFDIVDWSDDTGMPMAITLVDVDCGDAFTVTLNDTFVDTAPATILAFTADGRVIAYGPYPGRRAASAAAPAVAAAGPVAATLSASLYEPGPTVEAAVSGWHSIHELVPEGVEFLPGPAGPAAVILIDWTGRRLLPVGPFATAADADAWTPAGLAGDVQRYTLALRATPPAVQEVT
ncbi:hypothetical protein GCM10010123_19600 [Pilimelia anulata]|uniref:Uncharacterized protein n=1 Tax=Pilimelia anulata TaxID=53371 RepID=A0A8J3B5Q5_9ACTN|nr:hypothetical protein [Pilimelia anulata]GGJ89872.1 hypothetical protein GCM10010123_19600 [Pilimelia anulata]